MVITGTLIFFLPFRVRSYSRLGYDWTPPYFVIKTVDKIYDVKDYLYIRGSWANFIFIFWWVIAEIPYVYFKYRICPIFRTRYLISDKQPGFAAFLATEKLMAQCKILNLLNYVQILYFRIMVLHFQFFKNFHDKMLF